MDAVSWPKQRKTKLAMTMDVALRALCAVGWLMMVASCTNQSPVHENFDTLDDAHDIQGEESVEESMDVVQSDSEEALKSCDPRNVLPLACEVLDSWWWEGEENPLWTFDLGALDAPCELDVEVSHEWLSVIFDSTTGYLTVEVLAPSLTTGRHFGSITLHPCSEDLNTTVDIDARIFRKAPADASAKVLVVGLDGVRPDALAVAETPTMDMLSRHAAFTYNARTQMKAKTKSGPGWTSVMTGVDADKHNVHSNDNAVLEGHNALYPSFLQRANDELGSRSVAAAHWAPVLLLTPEESLSDVALGSDGSVAGQMSDFLQGGDFDVHFLHLDDPDAAGHSNGFNIGNPLYIEAIENSDSFIGDLVDGLLMRPTIATEDWLVIVTTDHGGGGYDHGAMDAENQTIFLIVAGASVEPEHIEDPNASHLDVHPTVMHFLGLSPKAGWNLDGQVRGL